MNKKITLKIWIPFSLIVLLLIASFGVPALYPDFDSKTSDYIVDENGTPIIAPPYSPSEMPPIGSDKIGRNLLILLIAGAKYTILSALGITLLRIIFGFVFGMIYTFMSKRLVNILKGFGESFQFIPLIMIIYALLLPLDRSFQSGVLSSIHYLMIQMFVISIVIIPSLGIFIGEEMRLFMKNEFIYVSRIMGGSRFHIIKKHLLPKFRRNMLVLFSEQFSQTLAILIQLGIIHIVLGGLKILNFGIMETIPVYFTQRHEWAAMISINIQQIFIHPWLLLSPLLFFSIIIFLSNIISFNLKSLLTKIDGQEILKEEKTSIRNKNNQLKINSEFTFINNEKYQDSFLN